MFEWVLSLVRVSSLMPPPKLDSKLPVETEKFPFTSLGAAGQWEVKG